MKQFSDKIAIIGVGLIGGSIALGLKRHFGSKITILGACSNLKRAKIARKQGVIDIAIPDCEAIPPDTKLIIIATPINTILEILAPLAKKTFHDCLIIDTGSTKTVIMEKAAKIHTLSTSFIGTHPMAGSEMSGFENASVNLFQNKPWIICASKKINPDHCRILKSLILILGANPVFLDAKTHDLFTIWASHIFLIVTSILVNSCAKQKNWKEIGEIASTGFRDTTRLASDNPKMKREIVLTNRTNILNALQNLKDDIDSFSLLLSKNDKNAILEYFALSKRTRDDWLTTYFS